jgi:hypothetical protein
MDKMKFIEEQMTALEIPYELMEWTADVTYPYFVGEFSETEPISEDGAETSTLLLTGFHRGPYADLLEIKEKLKRHFDPIYGARARTEHGSIAVFYSNAFFVHSGEADLKKIQINISVKEWRNIQ